MCGICHEGQNAERGEERTGWCLRELPNDSIQYKIVEVKCDGLLGVSIVFVSSYS